MAMIITVMIMVDVIMVVAIQWIMEDLTVGSV
jgi:hypothetical protein